MQNKVEVRRSGIHGKGVFAVADIRKGEAIIEYKGRLITHEAADKIYSSVLDTGHTFLFILNDQWVIDAGVKGNDARWINTSCGPNAEAFSHDDPGGDPRKGRVIIEARRNIKAGEEITYDYGIKVDHEPDATELKAWTCRCGSTRCRGTMLKWRKPRVHRGAPQRQAA